MKRNQKLSLIQLNIVKTKIEEDFTLLKQLINAIEILAFCALIDETTIKKVYKFELKEHSDLNLLIRLYIDNEEVQKYIDKFRIWS